MGKSFVAVLGMGEPRSGGLQHFERLRQAYGGLDGLALLHGVLNDGPLAGRIALVSPTIEPEWSCERIEINPLAPWSTEYVERYRVLRNLLKHPLADQGYRSIGRVLCTRPVAAHEPERAGRWWGLDKPECGIHLVDEAS